MFLGNRKASSKTFFLPGVFNSLLHSSRPGLLIAIPELWTHPVQFCIEGYWEKQLMPLQGHFAIFESLWESTDTNTNRGSSRSFTKLHVSAPTLFSPLLT